MWKNLINLVEKNTTNNKDLSFDNSYDISTNFSNILNNFKLLNDTKIEFGRYLVHSCSDFNIQIDVFSDNYTGAVHSHGTWGLFGLVSGSLFVDDWSNVNGKFTQHRSSYLKKGSTQFFLKENDWHRVKTVSGDEQTLSIHIYGSNYDLDNGEKLDSNLNIESYKRSPFKKLSFVESAFIK